MRSSPDLVFVARTTKCALVRHALHRRLLCAVSRFIDRERRISIRLLAKELDANPNTIYELYTHYRATFEFIARYEKSRRNWKKGRLSNGQRPRMRRVRSVPLVPQDPLLARLQEVHT